MAQKSLYRLFVGLLMIAALRHYGWDVFPVEMKGMASKGLGGVAVLSLIWVNFYLLREPLFLPLVAWWSFEELQVIVCSAWYMVEPWAVPEGAAICSAKAGIDLGAFGILAVALLAWLSTCKTLQVRE